MDNLNFDKHYHEVNTYVNQLAEELGHPEERRRSLIIWRAVMHSIRDRIHLSESFDLISQLPLILKGIYVDQWEYSSSPPKDFQTVEEMKDEVKRTQAQFGEEDFDWKISTEDIISRTIDSLKVYFSEGQLEHIRAQLPEDVKNLVS
jgi:uncharacterized protein (DUF2267 family)